MFELLSVNVYHCFLEGFCVNRKLLSRHSNVLKSMEKVYALSRLAGGRLMAVMWANIKSEFSVDEPHEKYCKQRGERWR